MKKETISMEFTPDGTMKTIYSDDLPELAKEMNAEMSAVCRASNVEFENFGVDGRKGWTVRSAKDREVALRAVDWCRCAPSRTGTIITFATRQEAIDEEVKWFWDLMHANEVTAEQVAARKVNGKFVETVQALPKKD